MNRTAARRKRRLSPASTQPRLLAVGIASASTLLFLALVLLSTSPPPAPSSRLARGGGRSSSSSSTAPPRCDLPFTVFVPSPDSFRRVLKLRGFNASAAAAEGDDSTSAVLSRVLGFSAVPLRLLAADVPPRGPARLLDSVSGLRIRASRDDARGALVVNGVRSECADIVRGETVVHVVAGVLMDADFERSFS
ncbi:hypothetical protein PVAP13_9NG847100, partial [Panicum virgatum]